MAKGGYSAENLRSPTLMDMFSLLHDSEEEDGKFSTLNMDRKDKRMKKMPYSITVGSVKVTLKTGNYFEEKVDAIVNIVPSNLDLTYDPGSNAMLKLAGKVMQSDCLEDYQERVKPWSVVITRGHCLPCRIVFHVVVMGWSMEIASRVEQRLLNAITEVLWKCEEREIMSISLPPMGTGYLGFDGKTVSSIFLRAVNDFVKESGRPYLQEIKFVIRKGDYGIFENFEKKMRNPSYTQVPPQSTAGISNRRSKSDLDSLVDGVIGFGKVMKGVKSLIDMTTVEREECQDRQDRKQTNEKKHSKKTARKEERQEKGKRHSSFIKRIGNTSINIVRGSLVQRKVDVLVNETNASLSLRNGGLSNAILKAAGERLQSECNKLYPNGLGIGEIARSRAFNLRGARAIYHTTLPMYGTKQTAADEILQVVVQCCLGEATEEGFTAIAFPALGTGCHGFPSQVSAYNMLSAVSEFMQVNPNNPIHTIEIVVFEGDKNWRGIMQDFQQELDNIAMLEANQRLRSQDTSTSHATYQEIPLTVERGSPEWFMMMKGQDVRIPVYWTSFPAGHIARKCQTSGQNDYKLFDVDSATEHAIKELIKGSWESDKVGHGKDAKNLGTLGFTSLQVTRIQRVENVQLYKGYAEERQRLFHKAGSDGKSLRGVGQTIYSSGNLKTTEILKNRPEVWTLTSDTFPEINEHILFHGTSKENVQKLLSQGIDNRLAGDNAMFGPGIYAAESSTKADQYSDAKENRTRNGLKMLLIRMCLGEVYVCREPERFKKAPCKACRKDKCVCKGGHPSDFYDSVLGDGQWLFREFVVYEKRQVYPEYLISYKRV